jgi:asparagine synthase (glutamine-hydrolysing)
MIHPRTGDQIVFNGEIYNFAELRDRLRADGETFAGHSDTEVLLHGLSRHGPDYIRKLRGMFAFAFFNAREQSLLLARDPVGIKPLYIARTPGGLVFASEVRAVLASGVVPRDWDMRTIAGFLAYGAPQQPQTIFSAVRSFPAGCYQLIRADQFDGALPPPVRYWDWPECDKTITERQAVEEIRAVMETAVKEHLVADVPVGVFLSSGLDSTIVGSLAAKHTPHLRAFTVGFADQPDMSEAPLAAETARLVGLEHVDIQITGADAAASVVPWLESIDQPSLDGHNTYVISKAVRAAGITVALSGQGGDELFGGYPTFTDVPRLRAMLRLFAWVPVPTRKALLRLASLRRPEAIRQKLLDIAGCRAQVLDLYLQRRRAMSNSQLATLGIESARLGLDDGFLTDDALGGLHFNGDRIADISRLECHFFQGNMLLRDVDCNSMAHSLEIRVPILDQRMLDLACRIPGPVRLPPGGKSKHLLRTAFADVLRPALLQQKKMGFTLPIRRWMTGPLRGLCEDALASLKSNDILRAGGIDSIWNAFLKEPESPIWTRAFSLCVLGHYMAKMTNSQLKAPVTSAGPTHPQPAET